MVYLFDNKISHGSKRQDEARYWSERRKLFKTNVGYCVLKIRVDLYKFFYPTMRYYVAQNSDRDINSLITNLSIMSDIPVLAVCYMYQKEFGASEELDKQIASIVSFYGYTDIVGKEGL